MLWAARMPGGDAEPSAGQAGATSSFGFRGLVVYGLGRLGRPSGSGLGFEGFGVQVSGCGVWGAQVEPADTRPFAAWAWSVCQRTLLDNKLQILNPYT